MLLEKPRIPIREVLLFGLWPGFVKIWLYRRRGYRIGTGVSIGFGSVICAQTVEIGAHTAIGFLTVLRGREIRIGPHVEIGSTTFLDTPYIEIGEGTRINEQVFVGGLQFPDSRLVLGRNCQIMQMSFLNPARSIVVGDDSGIGGHSLLFGHTSWLSRFEGYPVEFAPIEIGKSVSLAWGVFVLPRTTIGDGAVIGARSVVHGNVPPQCLAVGFPARIVAKAPDFPKPLSAEEKVAVFREMVAEMIEFFGASGLPCGREGDLYRVAEPRGPWWRGAARSWTFRAVESLPGGAGDSARADVLLSLGRIPEEHRRALEASRTVWIDIESKQRSSSRNDLADAVDRFLKRYGVRTLRCDTPRPPA
jgi:acetyltransferase-like isoleucine patch superfamily enzyme